MTGALAVGLGRAAYEAALRYSRERATFGKPIGEHQAVDLPARRHVTQLHAASLLVYHGAWAIDQGRPHPGRGHDQAPRLRGRQPDLRRGLPDLRLLFLRHRVPRGAILPGRPLPPVGRGHPARSCASSSPATSTTVGGLRPWPPDGEAGLLAMPGKAVTMVAGGRWFEEFMEGESFLAGARAGGRWPWTSSTPGAGAGGGR